MWKVENDERRKPPRYAHIHTLGYSLVSLCTALHIGLLQGRDSRSTAVTQSFLQANNKTLPRDITLTASSLVIIKWWSLSGFLHAIKSQDGTSAAIKIL